MTSSKTQVVPLPASASASGEDGTPSSHRRDMIVHVCPSGRTIEYMLEGRHASDDPFLFHFHALSMAGMGSPHMQYKQYRKPPLPNAGQDSWSQVPFKIVTLNRAGYGKSTLGDLKPSEWTYNHFAEDVASLADHLGASKFAVFGASSGGPYCIAAAALLPTRVTAVLSLSGDANYCPETMPKGKKFNEVAAAGAPVTFVDGTAMAHPGGACSESSLLCGCCCATICPLGTKADLQVEVKKLGYSYADISKETAIFLYHGNMDDTTDPNCARYLKSMIPHAELTILPKGGHVQVDGSTFDDALVKLRDAAMARASGGVVSTEAMVR